MGVFTKYLLSDNLVIKLIFPILSKKEQNIILKKAYRLFLNRFGRFWDNSYDSYNDDWMIQTIKEFDEVFSTMTLKQLKSLISYYEKSDKRIFSEEEPIFADYYNQKYH